MHASHPHRTWVFSLAPEVTGLENAAEASRQGHGCGSQHAERSGATGPNLSAALAWLLDFRKITSLPLCPFVLVFFLISRSAVVWFSYKVY